MKSLFRSLVERLRTISRQPDGRQVTVLAGIAVSVMVIAGGIAFATTSTGSSKSQTASAAAPGKAASPSKNGSTEIGVGDVTTSTVAGQTSDPSSSPTSTPAGRGTITTTKSSPARVSPLVTTPAGKPIVITPPGGFSNQTASGLALSISPSASSINPGDQVTFAAQVADSDGGLKSLTWDFGDGYTGTSDPRSCDDTQNQATVQNGQTNFHTAATHAFRASGVYAIQATAITGTRCGSHASDETVVAVGTVTVVAGTGPSNGPLNPFVNVTAGSGVVPEDPHASINVNASDSDGFISQIVIDWNDTGSITSPTVQTFDMGTCVDSATKWPSSLSSINPSHDYLNAGTHSVTVTVTTTGCDGASPQQTIGVVSLTTGGTATIAASAGDSSTP